MTETFNCQIISFRSSTTTTTTTSARTVWNNITLSLSFALVLSVCHSPFASVCLFVINEDRCQFLFIIHKRVSEQQQQQRSRFFAREDQFTLTLNEGERARTHLHIDQTGQLNETEMERERESLRHLRDDQHLTLPIHFRGLITSSLFQLIFIFSDTQKASLSPPDDMEFSLAMINQLEVRQTHTHWINKGSFSLLIRDWSDTFLFLSTSYCSSLLFSSRKINKSIAKRDWWQMEEEEEEEYQWSEGRNL